MERLTRDLHSYELVLLGLGIFLFLILSIGLIYYILKKHEIKKLLFFFPISIIMIGYPSIKEISISKDRIDFKKYQDAYTENPNDTIAKQKLEELAKKLEGRASSAEAKVALSKTYLLLNNPEKAVAYADEAIVTNKEVHPETKEVSGTIETEKTTSSTVAQAKQIKQLVQIQKKAITLKDTTNLDIELKRVNLDPELLKTSKVVKSNIRKYHSKRNE